MRHVGWVLLFLAACGGGGAESTADTGTDPGTDAAPPEPEVACGDELTCSGEGSNVCCIGFSILTGITIECRGSVTACGGNSRFACDDATDCGGDPCCFLDVDSGGGNTITAECKAACGAFEGEFCSGPGTCSGDRYCCIAQDERLGDCVDSQDRCQLDESLTSF